MISVKTDMAGNSIETAGGRRGFVFSRRPRSYPMTSQQKKLKEVVHSCGIKKGISRGELMQLMINCVGPKMRGEEPVEGEDKP